MLVSSTPPSLDGFVATSQISNRHAASGSNRLSSLAGPTMLLAGHNAEIYCARFDPTGRLLATAGFERNILLWEASGQCSTYGSLLGHSGATMQLSWNGSGEEIASCATDKLIHVWNVESQCRAKKLKGHRAIVNSVDFFECSTLCSGSDDGTLKIWDRRRKPDALTLDAQYPVLACCFGSSDKDVYSAGIDNDIRIWDLRSPDKEQGRLIGHVDSPTGLALSPSKHWLASNSMDGTVRVWDLRPYSSGDRCMAVLAGHQHGFEKNLLRVHWSPDNSRITAGSADRFVYVWSLHNKRILYKLPGHTASVNETDYHPKEPIVASASSDKTIYVGEIE